MIKTISDADAYFDSHFIASVAASLKQKFRKNVLYKLMYYDRRDTYKATRISGSKDVTFYNFGRMLDTLYHYGHYVGYMTAMLRSDGRVRVRDDSSFSWGNIVEEVAGNMYEPTPK